MAAFLRKNMPDVKLGKIAATWCDACLQAKSQKVKFTANKGRPAPHDTDPLSTFSSDVAGPYARSRLGHRYTVFFISERDTVYHYFTGDLGNFEAVQREFVRDVRADLANIPGHGGTLHVHAAPLHVHSDGASYYTSNNATKVWTELGCTVSQSASHVPQANGRAEALIKTLKRRSLASMISANIRDKRLWPEAMSMAVHAYDCVGSARHKWVSPYTLRTGREVDLNTLQTPFSTVWCWRPKANRDALGSPGRVGVYMGWCRKSESAMVLLQGDLRTSRCKAHHIRFDPQLPPLAQNQWFVYKANNPAYDRRQALIEDPDDTIDIDAIQAEAMNGEPDPDTINIDGSTVASISMNTHPGDTHANDRPDLKHLNLIVDGLNQEDRDFMHALRNDKINDEMHYNFSVAKRDEKHGHLVEAATDKELLGLKSSGCLVQVPSTALAANAETLRVVTVFCPKYNSDANRTFHKYKPRVCIDGRDFKKKHAPDADSFFRRDTGQPRHCSWRIHWAIRAATRSEDGQYVPIDDSDYVHASSDVCMAYLNADFKPPAGVNIYVKFPRDLEQRAIDIGMAKPDTGGVRFALRKAGYGLPVSAKLWENSFIEHLTKHMHCRHSELERCLFWSPSGKTRLLCHTDDCHAIGPKAEVDMLFQQMQAKWGDMRIKYWPDSMLGWTLSYAQDKSVGISAASHITKLRQKCQMDNRFPRYTPMRAGVRFSKADRSPTDTGVTQTTQKLSGILNYIAMIARPDCSFTASQFGIVASSPPRTVIPELRHAARYLDATAHYVIRYKRECTRPLNILTAYVDASDADQDESKSQTGFIIFLGDSPVHWGSCKQSQTSLSTGESETRATCLVTRELLFLRNLMSEMGYPQPATEIKSDSEVAITWNQADRALTARNKHLDRQVWFCKENVAAGKVFLTYEPTATQIADIATKNVPRTTHERLCKLLFETEKPPAVTKASPGESGVSPSLDPEPGVPSLTPFKPTAPTVIPSSMHD